MDQEKEDKKLVAFLRDKKQKTWPSCPSCGVEFGPSGDAMIEECYPCQQFQANRAHAWVSLFPLNSGFTVEQAAAFADAALIEYEKRFDKRKRD